MRQKIWTLGFVFLLCLLASCEPLIVRTDCTQLSDCYAAGATGSKDTWVCTDGQCVCAPNLSECQKDKVRQCVNTKEDPKHCGSCFKSCKEGEVCCEAGCVNTQTNPKHCGACGRQCLEGKACFKGDCVECETDADCKNLQKPTCEAETKQCINGLNFWSERFPYPTGSNLNAVVQQGSLTLIVGNGGKLLRSNFKGLGLKIVPLYINNDLNDIAWEGEVVVIVGARGIILRSTDSGTTWNTKIVSGTTNGLSSIVAGQNNVMLAAGDNGTILRSTDLGKTWTSVTSGTTARLFGIAIRGNAAIAVGERGKILESEDAGKNWKEFKTQGRRTFLKAAMGDGFTMIVGKQGAIVRFDTVKDKIKVFDLTKLCPNINPLLMNINDVLLKDKQVYLVGGGPNRDRSLRQLILNSSDNGETWRCQSPVGAPLHSLALNNRNLIAVGLRGVVVRSDDRLGIWQTISFGNTWQFRSTIATNSLALVTGIFGVIARSTNGGKVWKVNQTLSVNILSISSTDKASIAVGEPYNSSVGIIFSENSGITWRPAEIIPKPAKPEEPNLWQSVSMNTSYAIAVGNFGRIIRSEDNGITWKSVVSNVPPTTALRSVVVENKNVIVIGDGDSIFYSTNEGRSGTWKTVNNKESLQAVAMNQGVAIAVGFKGVLQRSTDGGKTWKKISTDTTRNLMNVSIQKKLAIVVGDKGLILRSTDAGLTWKKLVQSTTGQLLGVSLSPSLQAIIVGGDGIFNSNWKE